MRHTARAKAPSKASLKAPFAVLLALALAAPAGALAQDATAPLVVPESPLAEDRLSGQEPVPDAGASARDQAVEQVIEGPVEAAASEVVQPEAGRFSAELSPEQLDPWQPFNRRMHALNRGIDQAFLRPVARGYTRVVPQVLRHGVSNFFNNLYQPVTMVNDLLQGEPRRAGRAGGRFLLNLTLGLGGVLDPATHAGIGYHQNDFGHTLADWGWERSRYVVLPLFGPATVRDGVGKVIATQASPVSYVAEEWGPAVSMLYGVDTRAGALHAEAFLVGAEDEYLLVRDAYLQRRHCQLVDCSEVLPEYLLPDYEVELPDFEWRR